MLIGRPDDMLNEHIEATPDWYNGRLFVNA